MPSPGTGYEFDLAYPATILLTSGELAITEPLTIAGPGAELLAVSGNQASRVFSVDDPGGAARIAVTLSGLTIRDGDAGIGSGGGLWTDENLVLSGVTFLDNHAHIYGGGLVWGGATATLTDVTLSGNRAETRCGGMSIAGTPELTRVVFEGNWAAQDGGGMCNWGGSPRLTDVRFEGNEAGFSGGGLYNWDGSPVLERVTFLDNVAGHDGAGLCTTSDWPRRQAGPALTEVVFQGNQADYDGGAVYNYHADLALTNVIVSGNSAGRNGGGLYLSFSSGATLVNSVVSGNLAVQEGGGIYCAGGGGTLTNVTLSGNRRARAAACTTFPGRRPSATASSGTMWPAPGTEIYNEDSTPTFVCSDVQGSGSSGAGWDGSLGIDGGGNLDEDPQFVLPVDAAAAPTTAGNLHLVWGSPAIDAGDKSLLPPDVTEDLGGRPRVLGGAVDMGAYETYPPATLYLPLVLKAGRRE